MGSNLIVTFLSGWGSLFFFFSFLALISDKGTEDDSEEKESILDLLDFFFLPSTLIEENREPVSENSSCLETLTTTSLSVSS